MIPQSLRHLKIRVPYPVDLSFSRNSSSVGGVYGLVIMVLFYIGFKLTLFLLKLW